MNYTQATKYLILSLFIIVISPTTLHADGTKALELLYPVMGIIILLFFNWLILVIYLIGRIIRKIKPQKKLLFRFSFIIFVLSTICLLMIEFFYSIFIIFLITIILTMIVEKERLKTWKNKLIPSEPYLKKKK